jgi:hypothetical protein
LCIDFFVEEEAGTFAELGGRLGGEVFACASTGEPFIHFGMTAKIILKAGGDVLTLGNDLGS